MVSPRWRKVIQDLWSNKTRTFLVVLSIAVGVFALGFIVSTQVMLSSDLSAIHAASNPPSALLFTAPFTEEVLETVRNIRGVRAAEGKAYVTVRVQVTPQEWRSLSLTVVDKDQQIRKVKRLSGAWPPSGHGLLIERASFPLVNAREGDKVLVEAPGGRQRWMQVDGIVHDVTSASPIFDGVLSGYITMDTLEWLGFERRYQELRLLIGDDPYDRAYIQEVAEQVRKKVKKGGTEVHAVELTTPGKHPAQDAVQPLLLILAVMGGLSLFASGFLLVNTISSLLTQQTRQIGIMKAIGARTDQIAVMYLGLVLLFGLLSLLVAIPLGAVGGYALARYMAYLLNFDLAFRIAPEALVLQVAVGLLVPLFASLWPVLAGARLTVQEAISTRGLGKGRFGTSPVDRLVERVHGVSRPLLLSLRNTFRRKARLVLTLFTLTLGGVVFIAVISVRASLLNTLDEVLSYWNYDLEVHFNRPYRVEYIQREALNVPGVVFAESWGRSFTKRIRADGQEGTGLMVVGLPAETPLLRPNVLQGRWLLPSDENAIVINTAVLNPGQEPDIKVGDEVVFTLQGRETTWRVVGLVQEVLTGPIVYANYPYLARVAGWVGRTSGVQIVTEQRDLASQIGVAEALRQHYKRLGISVSGTSTTAETRKNVEYQFSIIVSFLAIMAVLLAIVGGLGLMGTMSINVLERTREIGVMRAIGASNAATLQIIMVEGLFIGALSWLISGMLAIPISKLMSDVVGMAFLQAPLSYIFSIEGALVWLGIVLILAALASFIPAWNAARLSVREVLAYE